MYTSSIVSNSGKCDNYFKLLFQVIKGRFKNDITAKIPNFRLPPPKSTLVTFFIILPPPHVTRQIVTNISLIKDLKK